MKLSGIATPIVPLPAALLPPFAIVVPPRSIEMVGVGAGVPVPTNSNLNIGRCWSLFTSTSWQSNAPTAGVRLIPRVVVPFTATGELG